MLDQFARLSDFIIESFLHIWPYLLVTIPLAVAVQMSGASKYIKRAFQAKPLSAILLATIVGAFSPFCSCGVIPVIASLLISGVPLAPVMSFWIASPSMDPEIFFLSVGMIGWKLAIWRLAATLFLSLSAGYITHVVMERGWLGQQILRTRKVASVQSTAELFKKIDFPPKKPTIPITNISATSEDCCGKQVQNWDDSDTSAAFRRRLVIETLSATWMVGKFMALAFLLEGLITLYVPQEWISVALGRQNPLVIITAALLGVPTYTTSLTALPMISGLLTQGMNPAAALAFLVAGPTTTLPAMAAVWPLVARRVFAVYLSFALIGAILIGYLFNIASAVFNY
jgi:uncharacterized membrane protein YraQ (UPF0718 family)